METGWEASEGLQEVAGLMSARFDDAQGGFGAGKAPFWERIAYVLWSASAEVGRRADGSSVTTY